MTKRHLNVPNFFVLTKKALYVHIYIDMSLHIPYNYTLDIIITIIIIHI